MKTVLKFVAFILLGLIGGLLFETLFLPLLLAQPWIEDWPLFKDLSRNIVNYPTQKIIIQEGDSLKVAVKQAVETVVAVGKKGERIGAGFALTSDGLLVIDSSLVPAISGSLIIDGQKVNFQLITTDAKTGLSLIRLENRNLKTTSFLDSKNVEVGEKVFVLKKVFPPLTTSTLAELQSNEGQEAQLEFEKIVNEGIIKRRGETLETNIQESATFGLAPAFNFKGDFVGMAKVQPNGYLIIIPADIIRSLAEKQ
jgi:hypothetical protein